MPEGSEIGPDENDEIEYEDDDIYEEFGGREFGGTYFTVIKDGEQLHFETGPGGITARVSEQDYATAAAAWETWGERGPS